MNLGDPELELIDPTPNIHSLFIQFDRIFFWAKLASRAVVRWSKRMYSCAGICSYEGQGGLCDIALSEPLLKLRPRKDLVETLLHEMIHAYLFVTCRDQDRNGHGPNFQAHMHRINKSAGLKISIYHSFHDEVNLYLTHVWRCNGPCQQTRPHFGIVRKSVNKAPGPTDYWWESHRRRCRGTFIKINEPDKAAKKTKSKKSEITKFFPPQTINSNNRVSTKPVLKDSNMIPTKMKSNGANTLVVTKKGPVFNPQITNKPPVIFNGKGQTLSGGRPRANSIDVTETVRNIWANKKLPASPTLITNKPNDITNMPPTNKLNNTTGLSNNVLNTNKHKIDSHVNSPPAKMKKIDDYFKTTASNILKDVYGQDFHITQSIKDQKIIAVTTSGSEKNRKSGEVEPKLIKNKSVASNKQNLVDCPVCSTKISSQDINKHLDECLNKEMIETLCKDGQIDQAPKTNSSQNSKNVLKDIVGVIPQIPDFKAKIVKNENNNNFINSMKDGRSGPVFCPQNAAVQDDLNTAIIDLKNDLKKEPKHVFDSNDVNKVKEISKKINYDKHIQKSDKFIIPKGENANVDVGFLPSFLGDLACKIENPIVKIEPGTSRDIVSQITRQKCACCGLKIDKPISEHLDECLAFFANNNTIAQGGASTSFANETVVIVDDDDDIFDETQTLNATGTKTPCPCCYEMVEEAEMRDHIDRCLS